MGNMGIHVSASNISELSAAAGVHGKTASGRPTAADLIRQIREYHTKNLALVAEGRPPTRLKGKRGQSLSERFNAYAKSWQKTIDDFEDMINHVPTGYKLVPVLYTPVDSKHKCTISSEFNERVKPAFIKFVVKEYADDLLALGLTHKDLADMSTGKIPATRGQDFSIDHIIERAGAGKWAEIKKTDQDNPYSVSERRLVNHFGNLTFMPASVHSYKNRLNQVQGVRKRAPSKTQWVLMLVPVRNKKHHGFVAPAPK